MAAEDTSAAADEEARLLREIEAYEVRLRLILGPGPANDKRRVEAFARELLDRRDAAQERLSKVRSGWTGGEAFLR